jgi:predicted lipid-binding transport protein (Tim44 family)
MSRAALGLSDDSNNSNNSSNGDGDDNNAGLIGGLVGGLVGGGLLIGGLAFCINRYRKRSATASLPIVFQANTRNHHHQQQQYSMNTGGYSNDDNSYPRPMSESTRDVSRDYSLLSYANH